MNFVTANYLLDGYGVHTMSKKAKARVDARPALIEEAQDGIITCRLCEQKRSWNSGGFTRHLRSVHELTSGAYYLQCFGADWCLCLCGCGQQTTWEPREGYYKGYLTGHNYRGKTKENDPSVALRANKMVHNDEWKASCFSKGQEPWNFGQTKETNQALARFSEWQKQNAWAKGKTKETDERLKNIGQKTSQANKELYRLGLRVSYFAIRTDEQATRDQLVKLHYDQKKKKFVAIAVIASIAVAGIASYFGRSSKRKSTPTSKRKRSKDKAGSVKRRR
jgi:hypothetical protein